VVRPAGRVVRLATPLKSVAQRFSFVLIIAAAFLVMLVGKADTLLVERLRTRVMDAVQPMLLVASQPVESIDALLGAFRTDPPRIYAGGPFSDRGGARRNDFERFLPLDAYERKAWKRRVRRLQKVYTRGLDALAASVPGFADLPGPLRDLALQTTQDPDVTAMMGVAVTHAFEGTWGAPEYGGNRDGLGWEGIGFDGDRQPRGYTDEEVTDPEIEMLPLLDVTSALAAYGPAMALATSEAAMGLLAEAEGDLRVLSERLRALLADVEDLL